MKTNNKIKTIIIDDESHWQIIIKKLVSTVPNLSVEGVFSDVETAYDFLLDHAIDLIFLDVQINGDNGIDLIKRLHKKYNVIIISSSSDFAFEGFGISAIDYLKKPIEFDKFDKAVQKAVQNIQLQESLADSSKNISFDKNYLLIKEDQGILKVNHSDIISITALENYVKIATKHKTHVILTTLSQFERSINNHPFLRVHRSHLINLNHVKIYKKESFLLDNDIEIPIGEIYKNDIQDIFIEGKIIKR